MYDYVVGSLDSNTLSNVSDIIRAPPAQNKYTAIKSRLIRDSTDSENRKLHRLLQDCELGDNKPSQLLRKMKDLSNGALNDDALKAGSFARSGTSRRVYRRRRLGPMHTTGR